MKKILLSALMCCAATPASSDPLTLYDKNNAKFTTGGTFVLGQMYSRNAQYGAGSADFRNGQPMRQNPQWLEGIYAPNILGEFSLSNSSTVYSGLSVVGAFTQGDGDPSAPSTTSYHPHTVDNGWAYMGWKSGKLFKYNKDLIDFSVGNQSYRMGDCFILADGSSEGFGRAAFYNGIRTAFRRTAILKANLQNSRFHLFHLNNYSDQKRMVGNDQPKTYLYGFNAEVFKRDKKDENDVWNVGFSFLRIYKADGNTALSSTSFNRKSLNVYNVRMGGNFLDSIPDLRFYTGHVTEENTSDLRSTHSYAYYIEPGYQFSKLWSAPVAIYRYTVFSGDPHPGSSTKKSFDPLFQAVGARDGFGTWESGQVAGQYVLPNSNLKTHMIHIKHTPVENWTFGGHFYHIKFAENPLYPTPNVSRDASREYDLYVTWNPKPWLSLSVLGAVSVPKEGMRQLIRNNNPSVEPTHIGKKFYFTQFVATMSF